MVNMILEIIAVIVILIVLGILGLYTWKWFTQQRDDVDKKLSMIVSKYNDSSAYVYAFDKQQEKNLMNTEKNMNSMFNNYAKVKNDLLKLSDDSVSKAKVEQEFTSKTLIAKEASKVGQYTLTEKAPKDMKARADGKNWLFLYRDGVNDGGLNINKLAAREGMFDTATIKEDQEVKGTQNVKGSFILGDSWIMQKSEKGDLRTAPKRNVKGGEGGWDWGKQIVMDNEGYLKTEGGGVVTRGGRSVYNPENLPSLFPSRVDDKNYIRGDLQIDGNITTKGNIKLTTTDPGGFIETQPSANENDKYGIGQYKNGAMRMYTSGFNGQSSVSLSVAKDASSFDDVIKVNSDKTIDMNGETRFNRDINTSRSVCFAKTCIKETDQGQLQACDKTSKQCRNI